MSKNFLYVIEVWKGKKLKFDAIRTTLRDAQFRRMELKLDYPDRNVKLVRYKRVRP